MLADTASVRVRRGGSTWNRSAGTRAGPIPGRRRASRVPDCADCAARHAMTPTTWCRVAIAASGTAAMGRRPSRGMDAAVLSHPLQRYPRPAATAGRVRSTVFRDGCPAQCAPRMRRAASRSPSSGWQGIPRPGRACSSSCHGGIDAATWTVALAPFAPTSTVRGVLVALPGGSSTWRQAAAAMDCSALAA